MMAGMRHGCRGNALINRGGGIITLGKACMHGRNDRLIELRKFSFGL